MAIGAAYGPTKPVVKCRGLATLVRPDTCEMHNFDSSNFFHFNTGHSRFIGLEHNLDLFFSSKRGLNRTAVDRAYLLMAAPKSKTSTAASSDPALQRGQAWVDVAAMAVLFAVLALVWYFL